MSLPAIISGGLKLAKGISLGKMATGGMAALWAASLFGDEADSRRQYGLGQKQLSLQEKMMAGQLKGLETSTAADKSAAAEYLSLLRSEKAESRKDKSADRRMQLIMMMMNSMGQLGQQAINTQTQTNLQPPPTSMMALMGGR